MKALTKIQFLFLALILSGRLALPCDGIRKLAENQHLATYRFGQTKVEEFHSATNSVSGLHPKVVRGLHYANDRFLLERPELSPTHVLDKQNGVNPAVTRYFVASEGPTEEIKGLGMLIDGTKGKCALETEFPGENFRIRDGNPIQLMEVARLGTDKGKLKAIFKAMAGSLIHRYGGPGKIPNDLQIALWSASEKLALDVYRDRYQFQLWKTPDVLGRPSAWVLGMTARQFVDLYAE